ncbi:MAG: hypothetical protein HRU33_22680 [Rhodobacteraceae bacterium]|nr:hypothetical protein [Paracoccaceae bacterium]
MVNSVTPRAVLEKPISKRKDVFLAPFSKRYKNRYSFSRVPLEQQIVLLRCNSTRDQKFAYIRNSKAGCTTIANLLYLYEFGKEAEGSIHCDTEDLIKGIQYWRPNRVSDVSAYGTK